MQVAFCIIMFILGACLGSFLCCQARRLRLRETKNKKLPVRSICPHCKHQLKWHENLPIISWVMQKGRCNQCGKKIGSAEILSELGISLAFLALAVAFINASTGTGLTAFGVFPVQSVQSIQSSSAYFITANFINWGIFAITLLFTLTIGFLAIYDGLYGELPSLCLTFSGICAIIIVILKLWSLFSISGFAAQPVINILIAVALFGGIYLALYLISKGKWVGDGDWILASTIAAVLGTPWLALIALFIANLIACLVSYPLIKKKKDHRIFFGPFLFIAYILTLLISTYGIINLW